MLEDDKQPKTTDADKAEDEDLDPNNDIGDEGQEGDTGGDESDEDEDATADEDEDEDEDDDDDDSDTLSDDDDVETLKKKVKTALAQKKKWREKAQAKAQSNDDAKTEPPKKGDDAKSKSASEISDKEVVNFRFDHPHLATKHVNEILKFARANDLSLEQSMKSPTIKIYISQAKKKEEMVDAAPGSNKRGKESKPAKDWSTASLEEVRRHRAEIMARPKG